MVQREDKMRSEWNERAKKDFMGYTSDVKTGNEQDYVTVAARDAKTVLEFIGDEDSSAWVTLDVGCGAGRMIEQLAGRFAELHGVDVSDEMIRLAGERLAGHPNCKVAVSSGENLSEFEDGKFNCVWAYSVFNHLPRKLFRTYLSELRRLIPSGGRLIFQLDYPYSFRRKFQAIFHKERDESDSWHRRYYTKGQLRRLAREFGFEVQAMKHGAGHDFWSSWRRL